MKRFTQMYVIVSSLPTILLMLTFVLWFMMDGTSAPADSGAVVIPAVQRAIFVALAAATLPAARWVRDLALQTVGDPTASNSRRSIPQTVTGTDAAVMRITTAAIVGMAIPEVSILLGFVLGFMSMSWAAYIPFAAYAVLGWAVMYPRPSQVRAWYARQTGAEPVPSIIS